MPMTKSTVQSKLSKYVIDGVKYPKVPRGLDGEILLEEVWVNGFLWGWHTTTVDNFLAQLAEMTDLTLAELDRVDPANSKGFRRFMVKWKDEGLI